MENCRRDFCNIVVHRASYPKHLRSRKHLENIRQDDKIISELFFKEEQEHNKKKLKNIYNPKTLEKIARDNNKLDDKDLEKQSAEKMINPYCFIVENIQRGFQRILESHNINHTNSILSIIHTYLDFGFETRNIIKLVKEMATIYAG